MGMEEQPRIEENTEETLPGNESDDEVVEGELLGISLHALARAPAPRTMRVKLGLKWWWWF
jgi:hypothetical protein